MQLEKAHRFLDQADEMCKQHYWDIASNRYYYACYHAVQALLIKNGLYAHTHDGLLSQFNLVYTSSKQERLTRISVHSYQEWSNCAKKVTIIASMPLPKRKLRR